uniref:Uncharacterized protein n=1 Tax=Anguilla anguilla TaxID=7936 RepID=A0A0E9XPY9_ANGAN
MWLHTPLVNSRLKSPSSKLAGKKTNIRKQKSAVLHEHTCIYTFYIYASRHFCTLGSAQFSRF